jgi:hypothetical protein
MFDPALPRAKSPGGRLLSSFHKANGAPVIPSWTIMPKSRTIKSKSQKSAERRDANKKRGHDAASR